MTHASTAAFPSGPDEPYPMFPLATPVLPGTAVPLQLFEPRYLEMIRRQLSERRGIQPEFGVVMIERGSETGGSDVRSTVGTRCIATNLSVDATGIVRCAALGVGRIRVRQWLDAAPYPQAIVVPWPDLPGPTLSAIRRADVVSLSQQVTALAAQLGDPVPAHGDKVDINTEFGLYQLAATVPLGALDQQRVLAAPTQVERADALERALHDALSVLKFRQTC